MRKTQEPELLPEQAAAAYEINKHISVTAGPGSGKTMVLVERYLHILRENKNLNIDQIVAITFTNRAANEMRERLRKRLNQILRSATGDERRRWLVYKRTLDGAVITTIHGFCARLLREFPTEAGVDPQFLLLDEHRAAMLLESTVEESLTEFISSGHVAISRLTLGIGRGKLAAALAQLYREVRGQGLKPSDLAMKTAQTHASESDHGEALVELTQAMSEFLAVRRTTPAQRLSHSEVTSAWQDIQPWIQSIPDIDNLADYCRTVEAFRGVRPQARGELKPYVSELDRLVWQKDLLGRVPQAALDLFARDYALELVNVLTRIDERLNEEKQKLSALDFDDLELRALELLERPEVLTRAGDRYKYFLVDEFQDTNGLQRKLLERLALEAGRRGNAGANLFIVGDGKQSIYGFRGADVDVFREMTETLVSAGGEEKPLLVNFRSQPPLVNFFNYLFAQLFQPKDEVTQAVLKELGYVAHEPSEAKRELRDDGPLVELMITIEASGDADDPKAEQSSRELDAAQLAQRIASLVSGTFSSVTAGAPPALTDPVTQDEKDAPVSSAEVPRYSDIALLFRAMTNIQTYESAFRRANIPYQTVLGRGFYAREEITDLIQLLRFLDNKTDELALAAVLRSPLCGISDNALLALRCGPGLNEAGEVESEEPLKHFSKVRRLLRALGLHRQIAHINDEEHELIDRGAALINDLIARRHHYSIADLLRFAVERSEYATVVAATFDGAQRLANVERLFTLAERFERSGTHLIRDFVRYVEEFEAIGSRESEGQIDEAANAVKLMTIHQAKGLEFPIVIIPELQRFGRVGDNWLLLDRHHGMTLKVPDGRGGLVAGCTFSGFEQRQAWREQFESMRLLYVAATRAEDRLIFSGTTKDLEGLNNKGDTWLRWIWQSLAVPAQSESGIVDLAEDVQMQFTLNLAAEYREGSSPSKEEATEAVSSVAENAASLEEAFPLLRPLEVDQSTAVHRFSVTQLINYRRCPRQYYFDRILHLPSTDQMAVWNDAEAPEPPANLTATLKGAVIHRFCETYSPGESLEAVLRRSFDDVVSNRQAELADRTVEINSEAAIVDLAPLAQSYLSSGVYERVERARTILAETPGGPGDATGNGTHLSAYPANRVEAGLWSELGFRLRRPLGILTGAIDKLLITPAASGKGFDVEIIDFKTNRLRVPGVALASPAVVAEHNSNEGVAGVRASRARSAAKANQIAFDFNGSVASAESTVVAGDLIDEQVSIAASDYQLQMQAYALAVTELMPSLREGSSMISTLHFLEPNREFHFTAEQLSPASCAKAIDEAMMEIVASFEPQDFPVRPATHCRMCNFQRICPAGSEFLRVK